MGNEGVSTPIAIHLQNKDNFCVYNKLHILVSCKCLTFKVGFDPGDQSLAC